MEIMVRLRQKGMRRSVPHPFCFVLLVFLSMARAGGQSVTPAFEVATVKAAPGADADTGSWSPPGIGRFTATHVSLGRLLQLAYGLNDSQIANKPGWLESNLYDVAAKPEEGVRLSREELRPRLQKLLQERFHLVAHVETRLGRGYALVVAEGGAHMAAAKGDHFPGFRIDVSPGSMRGANWTMAQLATYLTPAAGFPVVDETGVAGSYDIDFVYEAKTDGDGGLPSLEVALRQATGLVLKARKVPVETLVLDSVDRVPAAN